MLWGPGWPPQNDAVAGREVSPLVSTSRGIVGGGLEVGGIMCHHRGRRGLPCAAEREMSTVTSGNRRNKPAETATLDIQTIANTQALERARHGRRRIPTVTTACTCLRVTIFRRTRRDRRPTL